MSRFTLASPASTTTSSTTGYPFPLTIQTRDPSFDEDEEDTLPYPTELPRKDFLSQGFDPQVFLSTLRSRHQTLEDLRTELRTRSQLLSQELLDTVNDSYGDYLSLGSDLQGGGEKVEGVRVGVLGLRREVEAVRREVNSRERQVKLLIAEKRDVRREIAVGRAIVEVLERVNELELRLGITETDEDDDEDDSDDESESEELDRRTGQAASGVRLQKNVQHYLLLTAMVSRLGDCHPLLLSQRSRIDTLRKTLLLDLATALRAARRSGEGKTILGVVNLYIEMGAEMDSLRVLKGG